MTVCLFYINYKNTFGKLKLILFRGAADLQKFKYKIKTW